MKFRDVPVVFLSYLEDNAEANFADLEQHVPQALRVKGVKGFDAAHKRAAELAAQSVERPDRLPPFFITVDGDNRTSREFWDLDVGDVYGALRSILGSETEWHTAEWVLSWNAYNPVTGLAYGNGGLKAWSYPFVHNMTTHEESSEPVVDFCWRPGYVQLSKIYSTTHINGSPKQAYTAGFREGVKMPLIRGGKAHNDLYSMDTQSYASNLERLITWCSIGQHAENGIWSILGALHGFTQCHIRQSFDITIASDIRSIHAMFFEFQRSYTEGNRMNDALFSMRNEIELFTGMSVPLFGAKQSAFVVERTRPVLQRDPFAVETWNQKYEMKQ